MHQNFSLFYKLCMTTCNISIPFIFRSFSPFLRYLLNEKQSLIEFLADRSSHMNYQLILKLSHTGLNLLWIIIIVRADITVLCIGLMCTPVSSHLRSRGKELTPASRDAMTYMICFGRRETPLRHRLQRTSKNSPKNYWTMRQLSEKWLS
jgi:hypothetical protein